MGKIIMFVGFNDRCRSPLMLLAFNYLVKKMNIANIVGESAGVNYEANGGQPATDLTIVTATRIGQLNDHKSRWFASLIDKTKYDLFVCADDVVYRSMVASEICRRRIVRAHIPPPDPPDLQIGYDKTLAWIETRMDRFIDSNDFKKLFLPAEEKV